MKKKCFKVFNIALIILISIVVFQNGKDAQGSKIELMDYVELSVEEFAKETGIPLCKKQGYPEFWNAENGLIIVGVEVEEGRIIGLGIGIESYGQSEKDVVDALERFPYTVAGISLNEKVTELERTLLEDACSDEQTSYYDFYTSLYLSKFGIKKLKLTNYADAVDSINVELDMSLKEAGEGLDYIWEEREVRKTGLRNDRLVMTEDICDEEAGYSEQFREVAKTDIRIKYPYLEIPGKPEITKNANSVISEAVKKIEDNTYGKTDENIIVTADYMINYVSSKLVGISFVVHVVGKEGEKVLSQRCNINIGKNGEKAYLADWGITKEKVAEECYSNGIVEQEDIEDYLKKYDTNWDKYSISIRECVLFVKDLDKGNELQDRDDIERLVKWYDWDIS